jgi:hypothetical protein
MSVLYVIVASMLVWFSILHYVAGMIFRIGILHHVADIQYWFGLAFSSCCQHVGLVWHFCIMLPT